MVKNRFAPEDIPSLRSQIFQVINEADAPVAEVLKALSQCHAHIENRMIVEQTLKQCGLRSSGFNANEHLELYYDIAEGKREVGYISKGWEDPGFRVGDIVEVPKPNIPNLTAHAFELLKFCATRGVAVTVEEKAGSVEVHMESVIYSDGFNKKVFGQVLHELNVCVAKAQELIRGRHEYRLPGQGSTLEESRIATRSEGLCG